jgi:regulator of sigma E protease
VPDFVLFLIVLSVLILGHEFGHFLAAKLSKVKVEEFGIGFPPKLLTLFDAWGTKFTLNWIPLGGFVRPAGENDPSVPDGLAGSSKRARAFILLAGPLANVLLALVAFTLAFRFTAPDTQRVLISSVAESGPAQSADVQVGDLILQVDDEPVDGFRSMQAAIAERVGTPTTITLLRDGREITIDLIPRENPPEGEGPIGVILGHPVMQTTWPQAFTEGVRLLGLQVDGLVHLPGRLISGEATSEEARVSGLKGIHDMLAWANSVDEASNQGPFLTLNLVGFISVGLAMANLLPFPALDGGRLMFVLIELVLGRRIKPRYEGLAHAIGFAILLALMVYVNLQDFVNPINLPR